MCITLNLYYRGSAGAARAFAEEMEKTGVAAAIRAEEGNLEYRYFVPLDDADSILLIDSWRDQAALDAHHASALMKQIASLREKYDLHMEAKRFIAANDAPQDEKFIRR